MSGYRNFRHCIGATLFEQLQCRLSRTCETKCAEEEAVLQRVPQHQLKASVSLGPEIEIEIE